MVSPARSLRDQWEEPSDIFTVLLIIGGDIVQQALCAVSGQSLTPVTFSYGWVAYAVSALLSATGDTRLMPDSPLANLRVINLRSGYLRLNQSWVLGRLFQNYDYWMPTEVRDRLEHPGTHSDDEEKQKAKSQREAALCVAIYQWSPDKEALARPGHDWVWWTGLVVSLIQLGISAIPFGVYHDWRVFLVTASGTAIAYAYGALPQWRREKWACRKESTKDVALTLGNGSKHVVIVRGQTPGLDLEDLSKAQVYPEKSTEKQHRVVRIMKSIRATRVLITILAVLWLVLLITSQAIQTHTWYLVAVGGLGMTQNLIVAGAPRLPAMLGIPIQLTQKTEGKPAVFAEVKVMYTLMELNWRMRDLEERSWRSFSLANLGIGSRNGGIPLIMNRGGNYWTIKRMARIAEGVRDNSDRVDDYDLYKLSYIHGIFIV